MLAVDLVLMQKKEYNRLLVPPSRIYNGLNWHVLTLKSVSGGYRCLDGDLFDGRDRVDTELFVAWRDDSCVLRERRIQCGGCARLRRLWVRVRFFALGCRC